MSWQCKLAASSSHGDFEACVNLLQTCFTLALFSCQICCKLVDLQCKSAANKNCYLGCSKLVLQSWCEVRHNIFTANLFCKWIGRLCFVTLQEVRCKVATSSLS
ncbi:hypothetical protein AVEN_112834-1 [Araneus ventricosus]|uniref:Uncharacterized protein n=1 Tax=Araneus ventricosus TaxID=182803 RepID=A0A4Y2ET78_ARAVE|nr:hypothetical protein AVEN_112834-1 [Araneus ventricosus]